MQIIKTKYLKKEQKRKEAAKSPFLVDILNDREDIDCKP